MTRGWCPRGPGTSARAVARSACPCRSARSPRGWRCRSNRAKARVRCLDQDAGAVTRIRFATARPPVFQVDQYLQRLAHNGMRPPSLDVDDKADATRVVLVFRVIKAL